MPTRWLKTAALRALARWKSPERMADLMTNMASIYAREHSPREALRFLLALDERLYSVQGQTAVAYGEGLHPKRRLTRYHEFFTKRVNKGERILDIGCGVGALACELATTRGAVVTGIDLNEASIEIARAKFAAPNVRYLVGDATRDLPDEQFDVIILSNVLEHLKDRAAFVRGVLKSTHARRALIRVPLFERDWRVPLKKELDVEWRLDPTHETEHTVESFAQEMDEAGLKIVESEIRWGEIWSELCLK